MKRRKKKKKTLTINCISYSKYGNLYRVLELQATQFMECYFFSIFRSIKVRSHLQKKKKKKTKTKGRDPSLVSKSDSWRHHRRTEFFNIKSSDLPSNSSLLKLILSFAKIEKKNKMVPISCFRFEKPLILVVSCIPSNHLHLVIKT